MNARELSRVEWRIARRKVGQNPGFVAFAAILHNRVREGRSSEAFSMLRAIGCPPKIAHDLLEGWPTTEDEKRTPPVAGLSVMEEAAVRFAFFVEDLNAHNWSELIRQAVPAGGAQPKG